VKGWTSFKAAFVAIKENPQKITAQKAVQDKTSPSFASDALPFFYHKRMGFSFTFLF